MKIFQYAVIYHPLPTKEQQERGERPRSEIVVPIESIVARDEKEVAMLASRSIPEKYADKLDRLEIAIRPF